MPSTETLKRYEAEHASVVDADHERLRAMGLDIVERDLLAENGVIRHDPDRLAGAVLDMAKPLRDGRLSRTLAESGLALWKTFEC